MEEAGCSRGQGPVIQKIKSNPVEPNLIINKAFANSMVVEGIIRNLPNKDAVKKFRLLNRKFNEVGSSFLLQGRTGYEHLKGCYSLSQSMSAEQIEFLRLHGGSIKCVNLDFRLLLSPEIEEGTIREILVQYLPQLEEINLMYAQDSIHDDDDIRIPTGSVLQENDLLPSLRRINMRPEFGTLSFFYEDRPGVGEFQKRFFSRLFQAAVNLREISDYGVTPRLFPEIQESGKWQAVKSLHWDFLCETNYPLFEEFLAAKPALTELNSYLYLDELGDILEFSQETLEKLEIGRSQLEPFDSAGLENELKLTKLQAADFSTANWLFTKIGAEDFETAVPNLKEIHIEGRLARPRPTLPVLKSVESVRISRDIPDFPQISSFGQVFPSLSTIEMDWFSCRIFDNLDRTLWSLPATVQIIELYKFDLDSYKDFGMDSFLTRIPLKKCRDLQKAKLEEPFCLDQFRKSKGVLSLPNLRRLKFTCSEVNPNLLEDTQFFSYLSNQVLQEHPQDIKLIISFLAGNLKLENLRNEVTDLIKPVAQFGRLSFHTWKHYYGHD